MPEFPFPAPGADNVLNFAIVDSLRIPSDLAPGPYVVSWRWDAEQTSQVCVCVCVCVFVVSYILDRAIV